jgi:predicted nucleotidyltransferase
MVRNEPNEPPINTIVKTIVSAMQPHRIVMFGSRARGTARSDSDVDLMVEMDTDLAWYDRVRAIDRLFIDRKWSMDLLVYTPEEAASQRRSRHSIIHDIDAEGRVLYERS